MYQSQINFKVGTNRPEYFGLSARRQGESNRSVYIIHDCCERRRRSGISREASLNAAERQTQGEFGWLVSAAGSGSLPTQSGKPKDDGYRGRYENYSCKPNCFCLRASSIIKKYFASVFKSFYDKSHFNLDEKILMKSILFQPTKINQLILKNKFIMSAAADLLDNNLEKRIKRFSTLAEDDIGLIISGGMRLPAIDAWKRVVEAVHQHGGKIALQIVSAPGPGISPWSSNKDAVAVSVLSPDNVFFNSIIRYNKHHEASEEEIAQIIEDYAQAAEKIAAIGADAMQVHAAHQNFLSQFLSPITNKRTDRWGGSLENRTRLHREIIQAIRAKIGNDFPVLIKLGVEDAFEQGLKFSEGREAAEIIAQSAYDAIEVSQGLQRLNGERGDWSGTPMHENIRTLKEEAY